MGRRRRLGRQTPREGLISTKWPWWQPKRRRAASEHECGYDSEGLHVILLRQRIRRRRGREGLQQSYPRTQVGEFYNYGMMQLLFETPSGFAIFSSSELYMNYPNFVECVWAKFTSKLRANSVVALKEFQIFEDKSTAINAGTGVNEQLAGMIKRWHCPRMKLGVGKPEYKTIIETKLGITCMHNEAVMEVMWGIQQLMHILVPNEKAELTKEDCLPMSKGLKMLLTRYGFDVKPEIVNKQIVVTAQTLFACDTVDFNDIRPLRLAASAFEEISGINYEHWDALKLATALKVVCCPEEEIYPNEVLTQDELSKLKGDAPKYEGMVYKEHCLMMYKEIVSAHKARITKKKLLRSLVKKAKEALEAEQGKVKLQGDSEQIPQEHVMFANLCRMILPAISASKQPSSVHELPLPKVSKRSWDSAFEATVANKSIFSKGSSLGETLSRKNARKWSFSGAQPSTSKDIVPYTPVRHAVLLRTWAESRSQKNDSVDAGCNMTGPMEQAETLGIDASPLALAGDSMDEAITAGLLAEHSEQNEANILENVQQSAYSKSSLQQKQGQDHGPSGLPSSTPPLVGKVVRRSPRLNQNTGGGYHHVQLEGIPHNRSKGVARSAHYHKG